MQIAAAAVVAPVVGWFVLHHLSSSRDGESARRERDRKLLDELLTAHPVSDVRAAVERKDTNYLRAFLDEWSAAERRFVLPQLSRSWRRAERALRNLCACELGDEHTSRVYLVYRLPLLFQYSKVPTDPEKRRQFYKSNLASRQRRRVRAVSAYTRFVEKARSET